MPKAGSNKKAEPSEMDYDFSLSQQSNESGSDEQEKVLRETLEKCLAAEADKKRAQKEKKFMQLADSHLKNQLERSITEVQDAMKAVDEVYGAFLLDYAACEDRIHKKMLQLQELQNNLVVRYCFILFYRPGSLTIYQNLAKQGQKLDEEANQASSKMQVEGLSKTRAACIAFSKILEQLKPPSSEDWSDNA